MVIIATGINSGYLDAFLVAKFFITPQYESETKLYVLNRANDSVDYFIRCPVIYNSITKELIKILCKQVAPDYE